MNNTLKRALRTFFQTAGGLLAGGLSAMLTRGDPITKATIGSLVTMSVAGGLAALMNLPRSESTTETIIAYGELESPCDYDNAPKKFVADVDELPMAGQSQPSFVYDEARHGECDTDNDEEDGDDE